MLVVQDLGTLPSWCMSQQLARTCWFFERCLLTIWWNHLCFNVGCHLILRHPLWLFQSNPSSFNNWFVSSELQRWRLGCQGHTTRRRRSFGWDNLLGKRRWVRSESCQIIIHLQAYFFTHVIDKALWIILVKIVLAQRADWGLLNLFEFFFCKPSSLRLVNEIAKLGWPDHGKEKLHGLGTLSNLLMHLLALLLALDTLVNQGLHHLILLSFKLGEGAIEVGFQLFVPRF